MGDIILLQTFLKRARIVTPPKEVSDVVKKALKIVSTKKGILPSRYQELFLVVNIGIFDNVDGGRIGVMYAADLKSNKEELEDYGSITGIVHLLRCVTTAQIFDQKKDLYNGGMYSLIKNGEFYSINSIFDFLNWREHLEPDDQSRGLTIHTLTSGCLDYRLTENILGFDLLDHFEAASYLMCMFKTMDSLKATNEEKLQIYHYIEKWIKKVISNRRETFKKSVSLSSGEECLNYLLSKMGPEFPLDIDEVTFRKLLIMEMTPSTVKVDTRDDKKSRPCVEHNRKMCGGCSIKINKEPEVTGELSPKGIAKVKSLFEKVKNPIIRIWDPFVDPRIVMERWFPHYEYVDFYTGNYHEFRRK